MCFVDEIPDSMPRTGLSSHHEVPLSHGAFEQKVSKSDYSVYVAVVKLLRPSVSEYQVNVRTPAWFSRVATCFP